MQHRIGRGAATPPSMNDTQTQRRIGGFLPLAIDELPAAADTPWERWTRDARSVLSFHNARSALVWLLRRKSIGRIWLPAYLCPEIASAVRGAGIDLAFYGVGDRLAPDAAGLDARLRRGEAALGVDYFGAPPRQDFLALVAARSDVLWIEDRAQALDPGTSWGDWLLYSPRKLLGVADGGLLVSHRETLSAPEQPAAEELAFMMPALERFEDAAEARHRAWYKRYRAAEDAICVSLQSMSRLTQALLRRLDFPAIAAARRRNAAQLSRAFAAIARPPLGLSSGAVPFGVPVGTGDAASVSARLAERGLFCARHWPALACSAEEFPDEHRLARSLLTLPCDQRYGEAEMARLVDGVAAVLP